jgi:hypothetical protein
VRCGICEVDRRAYINQNTTPLLVTTVPQLIGGGLTKTPHLPDSWYRTVSLEIRGFDLVAAAP